MSDPRPTLDDARDALLRAAVAVVRARQADVPRAREQELMRELEDAVRRFWLAS
jgi:hypothetical protein